MFRLRNVWSQIYTYITRQKWTRTHKTQLSSTYCNFMWSTSVIDHQCLTAWLSSPPRSNMFLWVNNSTFKLVHDSFLPHPIPFIIRSFDDVLPKMPLNIAHI
jgi:hypothetical protein